MVKPAIKKIQIQFVYQNTDGEEIELSEQESTTTDESSEEQSIDDSEAEEETEDEK